MKVKYGLPIEIGRMVRVVRNDLSRHGLRRLNLILGQPNPDWKEWVARLSVWDEEAQGWYMPDKALGVVKVHLIWYPAGEVVELNGKHPGVMWYARPGEDLVEVIGRAAGVFEAETGRKAARILSSIYPHPIPLPSPPHFVRGQGERVPGINLPVSEVAELPERIVIAV